MTIPLEPFSSDSGPAPAPSPAPAPDRRPHMPEPPPVRLEAVADVRLPAAAGVERDLDRLYVELLRFEKETRADGADGPCYRAENFRVLFDVLEGPIIEHTTLRPLRVLVPSLADLVTALVEREIEHTRQRGLVAGTETVLLLDPAGNWLEIGERRLV